MVIECLNCKKEFKISPSRLSIRKFCSATCRKEYEKSLKTVIKCKQCGKEFEVYKHELPDKKYCSKECQNKSFERKTKLVCEYCGKEFERRNSRIIHKHVYCSHECAAKALEKKVVVKCAICGKPVERVPSEVNKHVLCSKKCMSEWCRRMATGENSPVFNSELMTCLVCGKQFYVSESRIKVGKGKFCSKACKNKYFSEHFSEVHNPNWQGGSINYRGPNWQQQRKRALMRDNFTCQECGSMENLHVHHIVPYENFNGDYKKANQLSNLITLCCSCHSKQKPR